MRILYADGDLTVAETIRDLLVAQKYTVDHFTSGSDALDWARAQHYDGIVLDTALPKLSGIAVVEELRRCGVTAPVLFLSAAGSVEDRVVGLDAGADDYLTKPCAMSELLARLRALVRRRGTYTPDQLQLGDLILDQRRAMLICGSNTATLSRLEYQLMELFIRHAGMSFSTAHLLEQVWGLSSDSDVGAVWVYISYLRKKLAALGTKAVIRSRRGVGYSLEILP